ncbi:hypothetical protein [Erwinia sp. 9145]|uniref:hypothetical protein n=1 Tax=Erwinia sp. 9145 TaxID=1500895 RepID=UPI00054D58CF|nr:hypothetical protein [Erwinia sp. 9145]
MQSDLLFIRYRALTFLACAVFLCVLLGLVFIDVSWINDGVHETSLTEIAQELMLLTIALLCFVRAYRKVSLRPALTLIGGFYSCMLIRELDFVFDALSHGSWVWFALIVTAICVVIAALNPQRTVAGLAAVLRHPSWGMMSAGLLTVLIFSRLFGMQDLWRHLMPDGYSHTVKNMVEEGIELLGYGLCFFATLQYFFGAERLKLAE